MDHWWMDISDSTHSQLVPLSQSVFCTVDTKKRKQTVFSTLLVRWLLVDAISRSTKQSTYPELWHHIVRGLSFPPTINHISVSSSNLLS